MTGAQIAADPAVRAAFVAREGLNGGLTGSNFLHWRKALAKVVNGTADAKILCIGDSTTFGHGGANAAAPPRTSWPAKLAALLSSYYAPAQPGLGVPDSSPTSNAQWTPGTGWGLDGSNNGWANMDWKAGASSGPLIFTPGDGTFDSFDVWYIGTGNTSNFTIQATGGTAVTVAPGTANGAVKATCTAGSAGTGNAVTITTGTGSLRVIGVEPWLSTSPRVRIGNAGVSGSSAVGWNTSVSNPTYGSIGCITGYAPDLTIIDLGINDGTSASGTANFTTNMTPLINAAKASGDVILKTFVPSYNDGTLGPNQAAILPQFAAMAASLGCGLIDTNARWVSYPVSNPLGYYSDVLHPSDIGYADVARQVFTALSRI